MADSQQIRSDNQTKLDTTQFGGVLSGADNTVQRAMDTLDNHSHTGTMVAAGLGVLVQDEGVPLGTGTTLNFVGGNVDASISGSVVRIFVTGTSGGLSSIAVQDEGVPQGNATTFNFTGDAVWVSVSGTVANISVSGTTGPQGPIGPSGSPGSIGPIGPQGPAGVGVAWDEGVVLGTGSIFDFVGPHVTATISGSVVRVYVSGSVPQTVFPFDNIGAMVEDEGVPLATGTTFNFVGPHVVASVSGTNVRVYVSGAAPAFPFDNIGVMVEDEGVPLGTGTTFNFVGPIVSASISGSNILIYVSGTAASGPPSGPAGGDLTGTYPDPIVHRVSNAFSLDNHIFAYVSGTLNNFNPPGLQNATVVTLTGTTAAIINSIAGGYKGRILALRMESAAGISLIATANPGGFDLGAAGAYDEHDTIWLIYSDTLQKWTVLASHIDRIDDSDVTFTDNTIGDVDDQSHGYVPKLPPLGGDSMFFNGAGEYINLPITGIRVQDEGIPLGTGTTMNFVGPHVTASISGSNIQVYVSGASPVFPFDNIGIMVQDEGVILGTGTTFNFVGPHIAVTSSGTNMRVYVSGSGVPSGLAGGDLTGSYPNPSVMDDSHTHTASTITLDTRFGDGADGDVTISGDTTLTRDMYYHNLTINNGVTLFPNGYKIMVSGALVNNGTISAAGSDGGNGATGLGAGGTGGAASYIIARPTYAVPTSGGDGEGVSATNTTNGTGGTAGVSELTAGRVPRIMRAGGGGGGGGAHGTSDGATKNSSSPIGGAKGGNGGTATGTGNSARRGGGGGGGGGTIELWAYSINNAGTITANGGNGGNGVTSTDASGNGGGGGGGTIVIYYHTTAGSGVGTLTVAGGSAGTGGAGGVAGANGYSASMII